MQTSRAIRWPRHVGVIGVLVGAIGVLLSLVLPWTGWLDPRVAEGMAAAAVAGALVCGSAALVGRRLGWGIASLAVGVAGAVAWALFLLLLFWIASQLKFSFLG